MFRKIIYGAVGHYLLDRVNDRRANDNKVTARKHYIYPARPTLCDVVNLRVVLF